MFRPSCAFWSAYISLHGRQQDRQLRNLSFYSIYDTWEAFSRGYTPHIRDDITKHALFSLKISPCSVPASPLSAPLQQLYLFWCLSFGSLKGSVSSPAARGTAAETAAFLLVEKWVVFAFTISAQHAWHTYNTKKCACVEQEELNLHRFLTSVLVWDSSLYWERDVIFFFFYKTPGRQTVNTKVVITLSREKKQHFPSRRVSLNKLGGRRAKQTSDEMVAHVYESLIHAGGEQHRNREHYSEIKVDLELLPHHLARAAGKSKQCWKWMNTQRG